MKKTFFILALALIVGGTVQAQDIPSRPLETFSLFSTNYQMKDYAFALPYGKYLIKNHPKELPEYDAYKGHQVFNRMIRIYTAMADEALDPQIKTSYLDSAATLYTQVFEIYTPQEIEVYDWTFDRGRFYQANADYIEGGMDLAIADFKKLLEMDEDRTIELGDGYYISIIVQNLVSMQERDEAIRLIEKSKGKVDATTNEYFDRILNSLFSNPEDRIEFLSGKLQEDPENVELMDELYDLYSKTDNSEKVAEFAKKLYDKDQSFRNIMRMADMARKTSDYRAANSYLEQATAKAETNEEKSALFLVIADNKMNLNDLRGSRDASREAIKFNPNNGMAYFKIAQVYANAVSSCAGAAMEVEDRVVYWLVLDYLDRAKRADPSLSSTINQQTSTYSQVAPSTEQKFFKNWTAGQTMRVDSSLRSCYSWINESTTVR